MQIRDIVLKQQARFETKTDKQIFRRAVLTTEGGLQTSSDPPNDVWASRNERRVWYMADGATQPAQILCRKISNPYVGLGVIIGYADGSNAKEVLTTDFFLTGAGTNLDGWDDTGPEDLEPGGNKLLWVYTKVITPLATYPDPTGLAVNIIAGDYPYAGARKSFTGSLSFALTQNPNSGEHYYAGLYLDSSNTLQVVYGTSVSTALTAPEPSWPAGAFELSVVLIDDVQTSIDFDTDIFDRRMAWSDEFAGGGWPFTKILTVSATDLDADYSTITAAIAALTLYDTILLDSGNNTEGGLAIGITAALMGWDYLHASILGDSSSDSYSLGVFADHAQVYNLQVGNGGAGTESGAIDVNGADEAVLRQLLVDKSTGIPTTSAGIKIRECTNVLVDNCTVTCSSGTNKYGIYIAGSGTTTATIARGAINGTTADIRVNNSNATVTLLGPQLLGGGISVAAGTVKGFYYDANGAIHLYGSGGTSQYVKQTTANGALTVGVIDLADLPAGVRSLSVLNTSGATAAANDVGYLVYTAASGIEYKTTTTVLDDKANQACVVVVGGANNATINVVTRGRFTIPYTGSAPAAGDYMVFSSTATKLTLSTIMRPEACAIAMAAGAGGVVDVLLLTRTIPRPLAPGFDIWRVNAGSDSDFVATINGTPSGTSVVYNAPSSGDENNLVPNSTSQIAKMVLHNTTRGDEALISNNNAGTNTITLTATVPASWASGDTITIRSQTNTSNPATNCYYIDFEFVSDLNALARYIVLYSEFKDSGAAGLNCYFHPFQAQSSPKQRRSEAAVTNRWITWTSTPIPIFQNRFCMAWDGSGTGTVLFLSRLAAEGLAAP